jgi:hypothetical protein
MSTTEPDLCARCGNQFPVTQLCDGCKDDAAVLRAAVAVLRRRRHRQTFVGGVFIRVLELNADRIERQT